MRTYTGEKIVLPERNKTDIILVIEEGIEDMYLEIRLGRKKKIYRKCISGKVSRHVVDPMFDYLFFTEVGRFGFQEMMPLPSFVPYIRVKGAREMEALKEWQEKNAQ
jgi:hypothetical protein